MTPADTEEKTPESPRLPVLSQLGMALGGAALASLACTGHAALRVTSTGAASWPIAWLALSAAAFLPAFALLFALPRATSVLQGFDPQLTRTRWTSLFLWIPLMALASSMVGKVLRQSTHHHALAGATFGVVALALALVLGFVAARLAWLVTKLGEIPVRVALVLSSLLAVGVLAFIARGLDDAARVTLLDGAAFVVAVSLSFRASKVSDRRIGWIGAPLGLVVFFLGAWLLRSPGDVVVTAVDAVVPLYAKPALFLVGR
jgi:hypothetical protein